jgi:hypothetical protein
MRCELRMPRFWLGLCTVCLFLAQGVWAQSANFTTLGVNTGCGYSMKQPTAPVRPQQRPGQGETDSKSPQLLLIADHQSGREPDNATIVGLWKVRFLLPDHTVFDDGYATWHSDGTELMNSGRPPMTGSFCMGVWQQNSDGTYKLNHVALSWDSTGTTFIGPAKIRESITVDPSGMSYKGTFTLDQFDTHGHRLAHFAGKVVAKRITVD